MRVETTVPGKSMMEDARTAAASRKKPTTIAGKSAHSVTSSPAFQHYQSAVQLLQQGKYDKALGAFEKLLPAAPPEILERAKMYIATCQRQLARNALAFQTPEERYDYAISQLNQGYFDEAREQLNGVIGDNPQADYAFYGLAVLDSITGHPQECLDNLGRAIELNGKNRLQARSDNDFQSMVDDPRFTELLYPEVP